MSFFGNIVKNVKEFYSEINAATLTGAIDVIVVEQEDGTFKCSPFHVRFGKMGVLKAKEKIVDIEINGNEVSLKMKLDDTGAAFFVEDVGEEDEDKWNIALATSPMPNKSAPVASFGGRALKLAPQRLNFTEDLNHEFELKCNLTDDGGARDRIKPTEETDSLRKGKLNKKKRRRRNQLRHSRKGSKSSLREVLIDNEMFEMDDVNDAEDELGGSEPEIGSASLPANIDLEFLKERYSTIKPKLECMLPNSSEDQILVPDIEVPDDVGELHEEFAADARVLAVAEESPEAIVTETVYVDTSAPNFHYFSDGEADRSGQPPRPGTPGVVSDSELESQSMRSDQPQMSAPSWRWGELPHTPALATPAPPAPLAQVAEESRDQGGPDTQDITPEGKSEQEQSAETDSGGSKKSWFWNSSNEKKEVKKEPPVGVYLDDILDNPDLQAKYLNPIPPEPSVSDPLDVTGSQQALVDHNQVPVDAGEVLSEDDCESRTGLSLPMSPQGAKYDSDCEEMRIASTDLPSLISRHLPDLAASMCGGLSDSTITPDQFEAHLLSYQEFLEKTSSSVGNGGILTDPNLVIRVHEKYLSWERAAPILLSILLYKQPLPSDVVDKIIKDGLDVNINISPEDIEKKNMDAGARQTSSWFGWWGKGNAEASIKGEAIKTEPQDTEEGSEEITAKHETVITVEPPADDSGHLETDPLATEDGRKFRKSLRLTSEQIEELKLEAGMNEVQFSVTTAFQGTSVAKCHIFLWRHTDKLVISDIDGTITKSDVLGHILPVIGKDWAHSGVADLYSKIEENGYRIMYLSARAIGQSSITKDYLQSVKQGDIFLPDGPVFLNPDSLIHAFKREVIDRNPEEFKIRCLKDIQSLFSTNPFFAGYGNRPNDAYAYRAVGIPISRIFTINPAGKLKHELTQNFTSSYIEQDSMVDLMFPSFDGDDTDFKSQEYSSFGYWRESLIEINAEEIKLFDDESDKKSDKKKTK